MSYNSLRISLVPGKRCYGPCVLFNFYDGHHPEDALEACNSSLRKADISPLATHKERLEYLLTPRQAPTLVYSIFNIDIMSLSTVVVAKKFVDLTFHTPKEALEVDGWLKCEHGHSPQCAGCSKRVKLSTWEDVANWMVHRQECLDIEFKMGVAIIAEWGDAYAEADVDQKCIARVLKCSKVEVTQTLIPIAEKRWRMLYMRGLEILYGMRIFQTYGLY